ncbi:MAG: TatD family hydrolase [Candidatus Omnitrophica bacterium]|nr:TatD family hydrolase [Candidatus Omnitrophota bacterium]
MTLVDTHVHFHFPDFDADRHETIERARQAGITRFINVGTNLETSVASLHLAEEEKGFSAGAGFHPHDAARFSEVDLPQWENLARHQKIVAIGEVGLDYFRNLSPHPAQELVFRHACRIARAVDKPLILHVRDAFPDIFRVLSEEFQKGWKGVFHCFSGDVPAMKQAVAFGFHISFSAILTYKRNDELRLAAREVPSDRILLETDAPFLPPQSQRGKRNESAFMLETARCLAEVRGVTPEDIACLTTENAANLFGLAE